MYIVGPCIPDNSVGDLCAYALCVTCYMPDGWHRCCVHFLGVMNILCVCSCCELYIMHAHFIDMHVVCGIDVHIPYVRYIVCLCVLCSWYRCTCAFSRLCVTCDVFGIRMVCVGMCFC